MKTSIHKLFNYVQSAHCCFFFLPPASFVKLCAWELNSITCYNNSKIFIQSALFGRSDNVTCLGGQAVPSCNASIDVSWRVLPLCQGKSSCVLNGSHYEQDSPCDGNNTNYLNITYSCKTRKWKSHVAFCN